MSSLLCIRQVLISVFNKSNILNLAQKLSTYGARLLSTDGTAKILSNYGIVVQRISDYTQFPEIMNGRIKTLHHKIYAGILNRNKLDDDIMNQNHIQPIDMIIVDFYPFHKILQNSNSPYSTEEILEYIDIGGPNMVRAAVKNYQNTVIIIDHHDYNHIINEMHKHKGLISLNTRFTLAEKALRYIVQYDLDVSHYFSNQLRQHYHTNNINKTNQNQKNIADHHFPDTIQCIDLKFTKKQNMCYGENPHQKAALYQETKISTGSVVTAQQLQGKPLSYNNIIDMDTALECVKLFSQPTCVIVKHANPCGVATSNSITNAYKKAYQSDPISAFGSIIAFNKTLDALTVKTIIDQHFVEAIIAPYINNDCLKILSNKKHIRILCSGSWDLQNTTDIDFKRITGGLLVQSRDFAIHPKHLEIVSISQPTQKEIQDSIFCWKIVKFIKSNAIVCAQNYQTTGIGAGQMNRINAVKIATNFTKLHHHHDPIQLKGSSLASDAFFSFSDGIHIAAKMGIRCIIQPGGSIKDSEIIKTANKYKIAMIFTHTRHFRH